MTLPGAPRGNYWNAHVRFPQENGRTYVWPFNSESAGSLQLSGFRENPTNFLIFVVAKHVTVFSGRTDAPEVRCDLTDRHTDTHTDTHTHTHTDPTTVTLLRMRAEG